MEDSKTMKNYLIKLINEEQKNLNHYQIMMRFGFWGIPAQVFLELKTLHKNWLILRGLLLEINQLKKH